MTEIPEENSRQHHVDSGSPAEGPRNQQPHLGHDSQRRHDPHHERGRRAKDHQRNRAPGLARSEKVDVFENLERDDPGTENEQRRPDVEPRARLQGRVERVQHRRVASQDRDRRHRRSQQHQRPAKPSRDELSLSRDRAIRDEEREARDEERREYEGHQHAVHREYAVVVEPARRSEGAGPREPLKDPENGSQRDRRGRGVDVRDHEAILAPHLIRRHRHFTSILANMS